MTKAQRKEHNKNMVEKAERDALIEIDKQSAKEIKIFLDIRRAFGSTCFP